MKTVHLIALGFTLASAIAGFAGQSLARQMTFSCSVR